jgi:hypothetical protein
MTRFRTLKRLVEVAHRLKKAPPLIVYQMGKVASTSIKKSLALAWPGPVLHCHSLEEERHKDPSVRLVYRKVIRPKKPVYFVSLTREPVARNISAFFQNMRRSYGVDLKREGWPADRLIEVFLEQYPHDTPLEWFDRQVRPPLGLDVYAHPFPAGGIQLVRHEHIQFLLLRAEIDDAIKEQAIGNWLQLPDFRLLQANVGEEKSYAAAYRQFKEQFRASDDYLDRMYDSKFFRHFYSPWHREQFSAYWQRPGRSLAA